MRLYIDPGTGSMLFTILIGLLSALVYGGRKAMAKLQFLAHGGRAASAGRDKSRKAFVIFSDHKRYWNVFEPVCDEFERRGTDLYYMTASPDDPGLKKPYSHIHASFIGEGNAAFAKLNLLHADIVLSTTPHLDVFQWKRSKNVSWYVHIPHGANDPTMYRMFSLDYYDAVLLCGEYQIDEIRELERKRGLPEKELVMTGLTYYDAMAQRLKAAREKAGDQGSAPVTGNAASATQPEGACPAQDRDTTILLAPSWGENSLLHRFGARIIEALVQTGYHIIVRPHPQMLVNEPAFIDGLKAQFQSRKNLEWNADNDNFDVLNRSDLLISDFSGVIFDFALVFDKPVLYTDTEYDISPLDCWQSDLPLWTFRILPEIGRILTEEALADVKAVLDDALQNPALQEARDLARAETWAYPGEAARRTVDYLVATYERILPTA